NFNNPVVNNNIPDFSSANLYNYLGDNNQEGIADRNNSNPNSTRTVSDNYSSPSPPSALSGMDIDNNNNNNINNNNLAPAPEGTNINQEMVTDSVPVSADEAPADKSSAIEQTKRKTYQEKSGDI